MSEQASILVKRYAGQRLYETSEVRYVTAEQVRAWHKEGVAVCVRDAATGQDVTRAVLVNEVR
jgi:polyhydroxyalkanoate synthesis regulator protein